jgi:hypothetical protein
VRCVGKQLRGLMLVSREHSRRRHHPSCNPRAGERADHKDSCAHAEHKDSRAHHDAGLLDGPQFSPQGTRTGFYLHAHLPPVNGRSEIAGFRFFGGTPSRQCFDFDTVWRSGNASGLQRAIPIERAGGRAYSPISFGIGADPGHHEYRRPSTIVPTEVSG